jgi:hypothetical protein
MSSQSQLNFPRSKTGSSARAAQASPTDSSRPGFSNKKTFRAGSVINRFSSTSNVSSSGDLPMTPRAMAIESVSPSRR